MEKRVFFNQENDKDFFFPDLFLYRLLTKPVEMFLKNKKFLCIKIIYFGFRMNEKILFL